MPVPCAVAVAAPRCACVRIGLRWVLLAASLLLASTAMGQTAAGGTGGTRKVYVTRGQPYGGRIVPSVTLRTIYVYPRLRFKDSKEYVAYLKLVRDVKRVLPVANMINGLIVETYEYALTLPTERERKRHMRKVEKGLKEQYTAEMKKMTYSQGQLLIKLIYRQSDQTSYEIIRAFMGPFKATFYQLFAKSFGSSLKVTYDPTGEDRLTERVVTLVENGQL